MGKSVNKRELAEIIGVSERTFSEYQKDGSFPIVSSGGRGSENVYDTANVIQWLIEREVLRRAGEKPKDRLDRVKADKVELDLAERLGQLAPAAVFERLWSDHVVAAKVEFNSLPIRIAEEIKAAYAVEVDPELIQARIDEACSKLEKFDVDDVDPDESEISGDDAFDSAEGA